MAHRLVVRVSRVEEPGVLKGSLLAQVVVTTADKGHGRSHDAGGVFAPAEFSLVGVSELLVLHGAAETGSLLHEVSAAEVLGVLVVVNDLDELLLDVALLEAGSSADVPLVVVDAALGGGGPLGFLVVLELSLGK